MRSSCGCVDLSDAQVAYCRLALGRTAWTGLLSAVFDRFGADPHAIVRWGARAIPRDFAALTPQDLRASRIVVCDPAPIPLDEMQRTYDWLKSWGMLEQTATPLALVNLQIQQAAHTVAAE